MPQSTLIGSGQTRLSSAQRGRASAYMRKGAELARTPTPYSREGIRKRIEYYSGYDDVVVTDSYAGLIKYGFDRGFISPEEASALANHKAGRIAALEKKGKLDSILSIAKESTEVFDPRMNGESSKQIQATLSTNDVSAKNVGTFSVIAVVVMLLALLLPVSIRVVKAFRQGISGK
jgi:hypothetical protein